MRLRALATALLSLTLTLAACELPGLGTRSDETPVSEMAPRVTNFRVTPETLKDKDGVMTMRVTALDRQGRGLTYAWDAPTGTLSAKTGREVTWTPWKDGTLTPGFTQVTVTVSNGLYTDRATATLDVLEDGTVNLLNLREAPSTVITPTPMPTATPSAEAVASEACAVGEAFPSLVAPGTVFYVEGAGLEAPASLQVAGRTVPVASVTSRRIAGRLPADFPVQNLAREVQADACGKTVVAKGAVTAADLSGFNGTVIQPGSGLRVGVHRLEENQTALPADLADKTPYATFLADRIDVPARAVGAGFYGPDGPVTRWFALRYSGLLEVTTPGSYRFSLDTAGSKLYVGDQLVIDAEDARRLETRQGTVELGAGKHAFQLVARHGDGAFALQLYWAPPGQPERVVPASAFSHE